MNYEIRIYKRIPNRGHCTVASLFSDIGMGLILSMVPSSSAIKQVYNCEANDLGPV